MGASEGSWPKRFISENKFGPGFREKLLAGIIASGEKKARKNGVNGKVDGFAYFVESLVDGNGGAAATLIAKMLPSEPPPPAFNGPGVTINVHSAAEGEVFLPGNEVLAPLEFAREAWLAFNAGAETWKAHLAGIEGQLTKASFEKLCAVSPHERKSLLQSDEPHRCRSRSRRLTLSLK